MRFGQFAPHTLTPSLGTRPHEPRRCLRIEEGLHKFLSSFDNMRASYTLSSNGIFLRWSRTLWSNLSSLWTVYCFESLLLSSLHLDWTSIGPFKPSKKDIFGSPFLSLPGKASLLRFSAENLLWLWFNQLNPSQDSCDRLIILRLSFRSVASNFTL